MRNKELIDTFAKLINISGGLLKGTQPLVCRLCKDRNLPKRNCWKGLGWFNCPIYKAFVPQCEVEKMQYLFNPNG